MNRVPRHLLVVATAGMLFSSAMAAEADRPAPGAKNASKASAPAPDRDHDGGAGQEKDTPKDGDKDGDKEADAGKPIRIPAAALISLGITIAGVERRTLVEPIYAAGTVIIDPDAQAVVTAGISGIIKAIHVQIGGVVQPGQVLAEIASPDFVRYQNDFILASAAVVGAQAAVQTAHLSHDRARQLTNGGVSRAEGERRESDLHQAEALFAKATAERNAAAVTLRLYGIDQTTLDALPRQGATPLYPLRAPLAGQVLDRDAVVGAQVGTDGKILFVVADLGRLWVVADVPENRFAAASLGSAAVVTSLTGEALGEGDVTIVYPALDQRTRTGRVRIALAKTVTLRAGSYVQVAITPVEAEGGPQVLAVPEESVVRIADQNAVFVATQQDGVWSISAHSVLAGAAVGGYVPIAQGLDSDDHVVVHGAVLLKAEIGKSSGDND